MVPYTTIQKSELKSFQFYETNLAADTYGAPKLICWGNMATRNLTHGFNILNRGHEEINLRPQDINLWPQYINLSPQYANSWPQYVTSWPGLVKNKHDATF